jgi:hypothetical protein
MMNKRTKERGQSAALLLSPRGLPTDACSIRSVLSRLLRLDLAELHEMIGQVENEIDTFIERSYS